MARSIMARALSTRDGGGKAVEGRRLVARRPPACQSFAEDGARRMARFTIRRAQAGDAAAVWVLRNNPRARRYYEALGGAHMGVAGCGRWRG
jgi:hypothetical protein